MPAVGKIVVTSLGDGKVVGINAGSRTVHVQLFEVGKVKELPMDDVVVK
jgi:cell fate regulator YaaT (PSP1 superfamily)